MVWQKPLNRLAEELGISGNGLAKICDQLDVPYPSPDYWARKEAGKPVITFKLPPRKEGVPEAADIQPPSKPAPLPKTVQTILAGTERAGNAPSIPEDIDSLHPLVYAWVIDHIRKQKEREQENRRRGRDPWSTSPTIRSLTKRDLYRFKATSAIFVGVERAGGKVEKAPITGKITFKIAGHEVDCSIVEKMVKSLKQRDEQMAWTAYPFHYQSGLESSGYLRVGITTYLAGQKLQWVETDKIKIGKLVPEIVDAIIAAGPILEQAKREREERERNYREQEARRYEARRLKEIDDKRWNKFRELAANWDERAKLLVFLAEVEARLATANDVKISDRMLREWIEWATARTEALDPFGENPIEMFETISKVTQWS